MFKILKGQFLIDDYDFCVAHTDMASNISSLRGVLRSKFPTRFNGGLGDDLPNIIRSFLSGVRIAIVADSVYPNWGLTQTIIGSVSYRLSNL